MQQQQRLPSRRFHCVEPSEADARNLVKILLHDQVLCCDLQYTQSQAAVHPSLPMIFVSFSLATQTSFGPVLTALRSREIFAELCPHLAAGFDEIYPPIGGRTLLT